MQVELQLNCTGGWVDYTEFTDLTRFTRELSLNRDNDPQKEITGTISFFGDAYTVVYAHLITSVNMYSNSVCIRVTDNVCTGNVYLFKIDNKNLKWCDDEGCEMQFDMAGIEPELDCIRNTPISDNTNNVFDQFGPIVHPRFRYCDVIKPTFFFGFIMTLAGIVDVIVVALNNSIIPFLNFLGASINPIQTLGNLLSGCARGWPSPFIRTYIDNVCTICGATADSTTMPVFYSLWNPLQPITSNPYYNATLLTAYVKKGVPMNGTQSYIPNNAPSWTLTRFLSNMKGIWNARWFINNNKIYFHRKDLIGDLIWGSTPVLDFTTEADKSKLLEGVCYEWNGEGKIRRLYMTWKPDQTDAVGTEALSRFRGEFLDTSGNPNYTEAEEVNIEEFSTASFIGDGQDSAYDWWVFSSIIGIQNNWANGGILKSTTDTLQYAKILIYDPAYPLNDSRTLAINYTFYANMFGFIDDDPNFNNFLFSSANYFNNPMSFSPEQNIFSRNLWQWHEIDAPAPDKKTNIAFQLKLNYCCQYANLNIYQKVKMKDGSIGEINKVVFDHETRTITINGNLL